MSEIKIVILSDSSDCDQCGSSWAGGAEVTIDGQSFGDFIPVASCYGGENYTLEDVLTKVLEHFGHSVVIE